MGRADVVDLFDDLAQSCPGADVGKSGSQCGGAGVCPRVRPDRPGRPDRRRQPIRRDSVVGRGCGVSGALTAGQQEVCRKDRGAQRGFLPVTASSATPVQAVEVFWRPGCPYCSMLRRGLARRGVAATWRDIWDDEDARGFV
ncbi:MAG: glutaredoxin domain-containing protein, partial [Nocardioides sp.]